jgi:hypothetical protein
LQLWQKQLTKKTAKKRAAKYETPLQVTATFAQVFQVVKKNKVQTKPITQIIRVKGVHTSYISAHLPVHIIKVQLEEEGFKQLDVDADNFLSIYYNPLYTFNKSSLIFIGVQDVSIDSIFIEF